MSISTWFVYIDALKNYLYGSLKIKILLATVNKGKVREYRSLLEGIPYEIVTPGDLGIANVPEETGSTFAENAAIKAKEYAARSGIMTLADDSGLVVDALGGAPGIYSARYAGEHATDHDRNNLLLKNLRGVPPGKRTARFVCVIAIASGERVRLFTGECPGIIISEPKGTNGFGYDPIFFMPEFGRTMAEISDEEKNRASHRAKAAAQARKYLLGNARK